MSLSLTSHTSLAAEITADLPQAHAICPYSGTTTCYDVAKGYNNAEFRMIAGGCRKWSCPVCGPRKKAALIRRITRAKPNRFVTLTLDRSRTPDDTLRVFTKQIPKLIKRLRRQFGEIEYLRMREQCADGYPHFHFLVRSTFIPHPELKKHWQELTQATIVDIRKAHGRSTGYVAKYISKARSADGDWHRQRIAVSQNFWLDSDEEHETDLQNFEHKRTHPSDWVATVCDETIPVRIRPCLYGFEPREPGDELPEELQRQAIDPELYDT